MDQAMQCQVISMGLPSQLILKYRNIRLPSQQKVKANASKLLLKYTYMRLPSQQKIHKCGSKSAITKICILHIFLGLSLAIWLNLISKWLKMCFSGFLVPRFCPCFYEEISDFSIGFQHVAKKCEGFLNLFTFTPGLQSNMAKSSCG